MKSLLDEALVCLSAGDTARAGSLADQLLKLNPQDVAARTVRGLCLASAGRPDQALSIFERLVADFPREPAHRINLGCLLLQTGDLQAAGSQLQAARLQDPRNADACFNLAVVQYRSGRHEDALPLFLAALQLQPNLEAAAVYAARSALFRGEADRARDCLARARNIEALDDAALNEYGLALAELDRPEDAEKVFRLLLARNPDAVDARLNLAWHDERANRLEALSEGLAQIPLNSRHRPIYRLLAARLAGRLGDVDSALMQLDAIAADPVTDERLAAEIAFERGKWLDRRQRYAEAHAAFSEGNRRARDEARRHRPAPSANARPDWAIDPIELDRWALAKAPDAPLANASPIFIVGFPRSGTTLLDQVLDQHPALAVMEERPVVDALVAHLAQRPGGYPAGLASLGTVEIDALRRNYWRESDRHCPRLAGQRLVDKYPLNLSRIHLLHRLFPAAHWIFAIRHPCDVVLSAFTQNFRFTDTRQGFWSIPETAQIYRQIMGNWLAARARLRPACIDLRYEDLVDDLEREARRLIDFLALDWRPEILRYQEHARTRRINTPSYDQVVLPIYTTSRDRWRQYQPWFTEALPLLASSIQDLGYSQ